MRKWALIITTLLSCLFSSQTRAADTARAVETASTEAPHSSEDRLANQEVVCETGVNQTKNGTGFMGNGNARARTSVCLAGGYGWRAAAYDSMRPGRFKYLRSPLKALTIVRLALWCGPASEEQTA
jgi:hypothetical protein